MNYAVQWEEGACSHKQQRKAAGWRFMRRWTLLSKNNGAASTDLHLVNTTPLKSGISGCGLKSTDTTCRRGIHSVHEHCFRGHYERFPTV
ncbi:hypothetical protein [Salibacterium halotolerans]|uniref:hypothetical protein n=1 Tax=Salibacterium halotolerans TaxID=1884432 RepID=UPI0011133D08|nr:hypothetical protein [Salibacterium halotolerans]